MTTESKLAVLLKSCNIAVTDDSENKVVVDPQASPHFWGGLKGMGDVAYDIYRLLAGYGVPFNHTDKSETAPMIKLEFNVVDESAIIIITNVTDEMINDEPTCTEE